MMSIKQGLPYKIVPDRANRYASHYSISPEKCLIVPVKLFGNEASCDVRWEDQGSGRRLLENKFFTCESLEPLNALLDFELHALWREHYDVGLTSPRN